MKYISMIILTLPRIPKLSANCFGFTRSERTMSDVYPILIKNILLCNSNPESPMAHFNLPLPCTISINEAYVTICTIWWFITTDNQFSSKVARAYGESRYYWILTIFKKTCWISTAWHIIERNVASVSSSSTAWWIRKHCSNLLTITWCKSTAFTLTIMYLLKVAGK